MTTGEQQELYDATWLILKHDNVVSNTTTYALAMKIADKVTALRDKQREFARED